MTDLRDQLADFEATARRQLTDLITEFVYPDQLADKIAGRILDAGWIPPRAGRTPRKATCHPLRPLEARGLCKGCYAHAWSAGTLDQHPIRRHRVRTADFADAYERMRDEGATRRNIADRLGMTRDAADQAYRRAVRTGALTPDRRTG